MQDPSPRQRSQRKRLDAGALDSTMSALFANSESALAVKAARIGIGTTGWSPGHERRDRSPANENPAAAGFSFQRLTRLLCQVRVS